MYQSLFFEALKLKAIEWKESHLLKLQKRYLGVKGVKTLIRERDVANAGPLPNSIRFVSSA